MAHYLGSGRRALPVASAVALQAELRKEHYDALYAFGNANALPLLLKAPHPGTALLINLIGYGISERRGGVANTYWVQSEVFDRPLWDVQVCATQKELEGYMHAYHQYGLDPSRLHLLPHSYDDGIFHATQDEEAAGGSGAIRLIYPVSVYPRKNIEWLIDVMADLERRRGIVVEALVTGKIIDPTYHAFLTRRARALRIGCRLSFANGLSSAALGKALREAACVFYPSFQETFGIGIVEALASGVPVVIPNDIPALGEFSQLPGVTAVGRNTSVATDAVFEAISAGRSLVKRRLRARAAGRFSNASVASNLAAVIEAAIERKRGLASFRWEALYDDRDYSSEMYSRAARS